MKGGFSSSNTVMSQYGIEDGMEFLEPCPSSSVWCLAETFKCHPSTSEGVHQLPQLNIHFPLSLHSPAYVLINIFYFTFSSVFPLLTWSIANPISHPLLLPYGVPYDVLIQSFLGEPQIMSSQSYFAHKKSKNLLFTKPSGVYAVYKVLWGVLGFLVCFVFHNTIWNFLAYIFSIQLSVVKTISIKTYPVSDTSICSVS